MSDVRDIDDARSGRPSPFRVHSISEFAGKKAPPRDWLIDSVLIRRSITLFGGDGGVGKSLACMQLQVAAALGRPWLGIDIPKPISSFGFYCEDDQDEIHRRFERIAEHYGADLAEIGDMIRFSCRVGEPDNEMVTFRGKQEFSKAQRTATYDQIEYEVKSWQTHLVIIDTVSDVFAGNENIRYQVKNFVTQIRRLALINNGGVILTAHPSKTSMADGSGFSGSTAWNGAVRNRLYLATPRKRSEDEDDGPTDERVLKVMKSNYGPFGTKIRCKWKDGVFETLDPPGFGIMAKLEIKAALLTAARKLVTRGVYCSAAETANNSLCALARREPNCKTYSFGQLLACQQALEAEGNLVIVELGPKSKKRRYVRPTDVRYPGEERLL